jgi:rhomboid protease GluP
VSRPVEFVVVDRTISRGAADERALVLSAIGIAAQTAWDGEAWLLLVPQDDAQNARTQLTRYSRENPPRRALPAEPLSPDAWLGSAFYLGVLLLVATLAARAVFAVDWWDAGALVTPAVRSGEWWRALTALTLHADLAHLLGNLGFGAVFGYFAAQLLGPGVAWLTIVGAAAAANYGNAWIQPLSHSSVGASTAVFAALGLLAAYAWRRRRAEGGRWAFRWAPLIAGVVLLAFTGTGGERTDVMAHLTGFVFGAAAGWLHAGRSPTRQRRESRGGQVIAGLGALAALAGAWWLALTFGS